MPTLTITNRVRLTEVQIKTLQLVGEGLSNQEIACKRGVSVQTVKNELSDIYQHLRLPFRTGREGIIGVLFGYAEFFGITTEYIIQNTWWGLPLTPAEEEAFSLAIRGMSNKEIAYQLGIAESTVKGILSVTLDKLNIKNRNREGIIPLLVELLQKKGENWLDLLCPKSIPIPVRELCVLTHWFSNVIQWNEGSEVVKHQAETILLHLDSCPRKRAWLDGRVEEETILLSDTDWAWIKASMNFIKEAIRTQEQVLEKVDEQELVSIAV